MLGIAKRHFLVSLVSFMSALLLTIAILPIFSKQTSNISDSVKIQQFSFTVDNANVWPIFSEDTFDYYVDIPASEYNTTIEYNLTDNSTVLGTGDVQLRAGQEHQVIVVDATNNVTVYTIHPRYNQAYISEMTIDGIDFEFNPVVKEYYLTADSNVNIFTPHITTEDNFTVAGGNALNIGVNEFEIEVSGGVKYRQPINLALQKHILRH